MNALILSSTKCLQNWGSRVQTYPDSERSIQLAIQSYTKEIVQ